MSDFPSMSERANALVQDFELLDEWEDRYRYLIELGDKIPALPESLRIEENRVQGCTSNVWLVLSERTSSGEPRVLLMADSDAKIVKGLVAVLQSLYQDQPRQEVATFPIEQLFDQLGLNKHLSRSRSNGLNSMVKRIRGWAAAKVS